MIARRKSKTVFFMCSLKRTSHAGMRKDCAGGLASGKAVFLEWLCSVKQS
jgi:hypothetical protein